MEPVSVAAEVGDGRPADEDHELALTCKALAHPVRIRILRLLRQADRCICGEIVEMLPLAQSTVSQHLKILKGAGLIVGAIEGPRTCYCLDKKKLVQLKKRIAGL